MLAGAPPHNLDVPTTVEALAGNDSVRCIWRNQAGGLTFELTAGVKRRFVKWAPVNSGIDLRAEAERLSWAVQFTPVPRCLDRGGDAMGTWLMTEPVPGESAVAERWYREARVAVRAIGEGLRAFHDTVPVGRCPFEWSARSRLTAAGRLASLGRLDPATWHPEHRALSVNRALELLADIPSVESAVVCHGDACAPNTLLSEDGRWSGHVDVGAMGVGDRWADLAVATWSATWNYGEGWEDELLAAYGVEPDPERSRYYPLLWDLGP
jgi:kanamycin kinase